MVLIAPYRPSAANQIQIQPTNVSGSVGSSIVTPVNGSVTTSTTSSRDTVLDGSGGFTSTYETDYPWSFVNPSFNSSTMSTSFGTLNGANAITVTWDAGASTGDRWGGGLNLPSSYDEAWFTCEFKLSANFSTGTSLHTGKLCGLTGVSSVSGCVDVNCGDGWACRQNWREPIGDEIEMMHYLYYPDKTVPCGQNIVWPTRIERDTLYVMEQHVILNSDFNTADGVIETKLNGVVASNTPGVRLYCGSEANRAASMIGQVSWHVFWGGSGSSWSPATESAITFGRFKVEIPA